MDTLMHPDITGRLEELRNQIRLACENCGREPASVKLLAVSKTKTAADVHAALSAGQHAFGENYLQEAIDKINAIPGAEWHFIGAIQSNKTRDIAAHFDWVHSVASSKVARRLSEQRPDNKAPLNVLIQVNVSGEDQKSGIDPDGALALVRQAQSFEHIRLRGLMAIPSPQIDPARQHLPFARLRELRDSIRDTLGLADFDQLSMGMSADFQAAVAEGATWIRIGTAIFGPRTT